MAEVLYGVRSYTYSEKTKRPQKVSCDKETLDKRNSKQRKLYITLDNIDEIFSNNEDKYPVCYDMIFNLIQGKVTKYFNGRSYDRKKELSYDSINRLYSALKRKLLYLESQRGLLKPPPVLFFQLSQFFRYVDLVVFSTVHYGAEDLKHIIQEPDGFKTEDVLQNVQPDGDCFLNENMFDDTVSAWDKLLEDHSVVQTPVDIDELIVDKSQQIKETIDKLDYLDNNEKKVIWKVYKGSYSLFGEYKLTKRETEILSSIQEKISKDENFLKELEETLNGKGKGS